MAAELGAGDCAAQVDPDEHLRRIVAIHFDPAGGSAYWLERAAALGIDARAEIRTDRDLERLGPMDENALRDRPLLDLVPRRLHGALAGAIVAETGGATGRPKRTLFAPDEFRQAFVDPFVWVADRTAFPRRGLWLWVGPSGPHVIGQAAAACAAALDSPQPFSVDFDPRWFRKLPPDSFARQRYLEHVIDQAMHILAAEPVEVLFTTPAVLGRLAEAMGDARRERIRGVHYGGMRVESSVLRAAQTSWFPRAVHLAGYGNSLFGLCMELGGPPERTLRYFPCGPRHRVRVAEDGRVWMSRLDRTVLIANLPERDAGRAIAPDGPPFGPGVEDPHPFQPVASAEGIY